jgi:hypothetical protein
MIMNNDSGGGGKRPESVEVKGTDKNQQSPQFKYQVLCWDLNHIWFMVCCT